MPCPPPEDLPDIGTEPAGLLSLALIGRFFITSATWGCVARCVICTCGCKCMRIIPLKVEILCSYSFCSSILLYLICRNNLQLFGRFSYKYLERIERTRKKDQAVKHLFQAFFPRQGEQYSKDFKYSGPTDKTNPLLKRMVPYVFLLPLNVI